MRHLRFIVDFVLVVFSIGALAQESAPAQTELRTHEVEIATRQGEFNALQNSRRALAAKIQNVEFEISRLSAQAWTRKVHSRAEGSARPSGRA